jgi:hypothetical protein
VGREMAVGTAIRYGLGAPGIESRGGEIFRTRPDLPWGSPNLLYDGYRVFLGVKATELWPRLKKQYSHTSTPSLGLIGLF